MGFSGALSDNNIAGLRVKRPAAVAQNSMRPPSQTSRAMISVESGVRYRLRLPGDKQGPGAPGGKPESAVEEKTAREEEALIRCRQCGHGVTHPAERTEKDGAHRHTFANPHGIVFEIGCFRSAAGCGYTGPATGEFTWFRGYRWRVGVCRACLTHLGWLFTSESTDAFYGLIIDRLVFPD